MNEISLIAPCGMNCGICMAYLRKEKHCVGCRGVDTDKMKTCRECKIKNCTVMKTQKINYCFECNQFPCQKIKHIDDRYRKKYGMSMIENLLMIKEKGMRVFLENEKEKWTCKKCGGTINVHRWKCSNCGEDRV